MRAALPSTLLCAATAAGLAGAQPASEAPAYGVLEAVRDSRGNEGLRELFEHPVRAADEYIVRLTDGRSVVLAIEASQRLEPGQPVLVHARRDRVRVEPHYPPTQGDTR